MKPWHIVVVLIVVLLLFGAPKLPELAKALGQSMRILKDETKALTSDDEAQSKPASDEDNSK